MKVVKRRNWVKLPKTKERTTRDQLFHFSLGDPSPIKQNVRTYELCRSLKFGNCLTNSALTTCDCEGCQGYYGYRNQALAKFIYFDLDNPLSPSKCSWEIAKFESILSRDNGLFLLNHDVFLIDRNYLLFPNGKIFDIKLLKCWLIGNLFVQANDMFESCDAVNQIIYQKIQSYSDAERNKHKYIYVFSKNGTEIKAYLCVLATYVLTSDCIRLETYFGGDLFLYPNGRAIVDVSDDLDVD